MEFSPQQRAAIEKRGASVILGAAAGSGKTTVMVTRIAQMLIEGRCSAKELLVLTFTRAAASNMLFKLEEKLSDIEHPLAQKALKELPYAQISTFDSFCTALVRRYFYLLDIQADARMLDQNEADELARTVVTSTVEEASQLCENGEFASLELLYGVFSNGKQDDKLVEAVQKLYKHCRLYPDPAARLAELCGRVDISKYVESDLEYVKKRVVAGKDALKREKEIAGILGEDSAAALNVAAEDERVYAQLIDARSIEELSVDFARMSLKEFKIKDAQNKELFNPVREVVKAQVDRKNIMSRYKNVTKESLEELELIYAALGKLTDMYSSNMEKEFLRRNVLTFDRCQHLALCLLGIPEVANELRGTYKYIFVDEDQDSNRMQRNMLDLLANDNKSNLFMVGDIKQSIYRFRNAEPELFIDNIREYNASKDGFRCVMRLNNNFRSHSNILDCVNLIFKHNMHSDFFQIDYDRNEELIPPSDDQNNKFWQNNPEFMHPTEVVLLEKDDGNLKADDVRAVEAMEAVRLVKDHLGTPIPCGDGKTRPAQFGDIAILALNANKLSPVYVDAFAKAGIPFVPSGDLSVFDSYEVNCVLDLLRIIDNRLDDFAMFSALRLYGFTFDKIIDIRSVDKKSSFSQCVIDSDDQEVRGFLKEIDRLRFLCACKPIWKVLWEIYHSTGIYARCAALPDGKERTANLREFAVFAEKYCSAEGMTLREFIRLCSGENKPIMLNEAEVAGNSVHMLTIHKSKGLEFPIVILVGCGADIFNGGKDGSINVSRELGLGINPEVKNGAGEYVYGSIKLREKELRRSEQLRNLYVALTRAVNKLIMVGEYNAKADLAFDKSRFDAKCFFDFILPPVLAQPDCRDFALSQEILPISCEQLGRWECKKVRMSQVAQVYYKAPQATTVKPDAELTEAAYQSMRFEYHHQAAADLAVKAGASDRDKNYELSPPDFLCSISGTGIGSAYHALLEHTDFKTDPQITLDKLVNNGVISNEIAQRLDLNKLRRLFASELGKELADAKPVREAPFTMMEQKDGENYLVQGIIDCFYVVDGKAVLLDFKSDSTDCGVEVLTKKYRPQLELYRKALKKCFGLECARASLYFLDGVRVDV